PSNTNLHSLAVDGPASQNRARYTTSGADSTVRGAAFAMQGEAYRSAAAIRAPPVNPRGHGPRTRVQSIGRPSAGCSSLPPLARPSTPPLRSGVLRFAPPLRVTDASPVDGGPAL